MEIFFLPWGGCISCLCGCLGVRLLPQSYQYPNLSEGADCFSGQLRGDKECPFSGVTKFGRVWRKVLESDARSVCVCARVHTHVGVCVGAIFVCFCFACFPLWLQFSFVAFSCLTVTPQVLTASLPPCVCTIVGYVITSPISPSLCAWHQQKMDYYLSVFEAGA